MVVVRGAAHDGMRPGSGVSRPRASGHQVEAAPSLAMSVYEVTFEDYDRFTSAGRADGEDRGRVRRPMINVWRVEASRGAVRDTRR